MQRGIRAVLCRVAWWGCLGGLLVARLEAAAPAAGWERVADLPQGNGGFAYGLVGGEIVIAGGTNWPGDVKVWLDEIWAFEPKRGSWRQAGRLEKPVAYAAFDANPDGIWLAGGSGGAEAHRSLWQVGKGAVAKRIAPLPAGAVYASAVVLGDTLYTVGGSDDQSRMDHLRNQVWSVNLRTGAAERLADYPERAFGVGAAAGASGRVYVFGGARWDAKAQAVENLASAHVYSLTARRWTPLPPLPYANRGPTAVQLDDAHLLIAGGYKNDAEEFVSDTYVFDVTGSRYRLTTPLPYKASSVGLVKVGEWLYCLGGEDRKKHRTALVYRIRWHDLITASR